MTVRRRWWWIGGAILIALAGLLHLITPDSQFGDVLFVFSVLWLLVSGFILVWWLWRWMTYRVGVRLAMTFLLVGVLPVLFAAAFAAIGLYILIGQYTSVRIGSEFDRFYWTFGAEGSIVLTAARQEGIEAAITDLEKIHSDPLDPLTRVLWRAHIGDREVSLTDPDFRPDLEWLPKGTSFWIAHHQGRIFSVTANRADNGDWVAALIPFDDVTSTDLSSKWWFDVAFIDEGLSENGLEAELQYGDSTTEDEESIESEDEGAVRFRVSGEEVNEDSLWPKWTGEDEGLFSKPFVIWFRMVSNLVELESGEPVESGRSIALLRTSPMNAWDDFTLSEYELRTELWGGIAALGIMFLLGYGFVLAAAAMVIVSIARSTARLSKGAREVERGNLDHRVPVKRRDQLGDLAVSFNQMTDSVQSMLLDVAEKERLASELELAREIQESLLPARRIELGPVTVTATFQPATEVGGDYFDVFSLSDERLAVAIGDVAGHGLSTGLLMASLKSSVAALVHEGYGGTELIEKVNRLVLDQAQARTMVTLSVFEIDLANDRIDLANAGHPPAFLIGGNDGPRELLVSSVPMGSGLCRPKSLQIPFPGGSTLLLYSDGLVEAASADGEPFGYERLHRILERSADSPGVDLTAAVLESLSDHTGGTLLADDLTVLVVERVG